MDTEKHDQIKNTLRLDLMKSKIDQIQSCNTRFMVDGAGKVYLSNGADEYILCGSRKSGEVLITALNDVISPILKRVETILQKELKELV